MKKLTVRLTYFKRGGKFYSEGEFKVDSTASLLEVWDMVKKMHKDGELPGLVSGARFPFIYVNVPGHEAEHPWLFVDQEGLET
jgi:hypothetical protein